MPYLPVPPPHSGRRIFFLPLLHCTLNNRLLDIAQSAYLFRQALYSFALLTLSGAVLVFYLFRKAARLRKSGQRLSFFRLCFALLLVGILYGLFFSFGFLKDWQLRSRGHETTGTTLRWVDLGDGDREVRFEYSVNGVRSEKQAAAVYYGARIGGIVCPGGQYVVLYDPEDPENALIDFRRPVAKGSDQQAKGD